VPRRAAISGYFVVLLVLCALTWALWQWRFVAVPGSPALTLGFTPDGLARSVSGPVVQQGDRLLLPGGAEIPQVEYHWTRPPEARHAHVALRVSCRGVEVGKMPWDDARVILIWVDGAGKMVQGHLPLWSGRGDHPNAFRDMVVPLSRGGTLPKIVFENRGSAGEFKVESIQIQAVDHRAGLVWMTVGILLAWLAMISFGFRKWVAAAPVGAPRILAAAVVWVGFAWAYCLPGPWNPFPSLGTPYPIEAVAPPPPTPALLPPSKPVAEPAPAADPGHELVAPAPAPAVPAKAELTAEPATPERLEGGLVRWLFNHLPYLKRPLHLLAFAALTALLALLTGSRRAMWPAIVLGVISEVCQWAFGFGFDLSDVLDLVMDAAAALAGLVLWRWSLRLWNKLPLPRWLSSRSPVTAA
jgi:hypothetical protein